MGRWLLLYANNGRCVTNNFVVYVQQHITALGACLQQSEIQTHTKLTQQLRIIDNYDDHMKSLHLSSLEVNNSFTRKHGAVQSSSPVAQLDLRSSAETEGSTMPGDHGIRLYHSPCWGMGIQRRYSGTYV